MKAHYRGLAAIALVLTGGAARAAGEADFQVGEEKLHWSLPEAYCVPEGAVAGAAQKIATADPTNVTQFTAVSCAGNPFGKYVLFKTPAQALLVRIDRPTLMAQVGAEFDNGGFDKLMKSGEIDRTTADAFAKTLQLDAEVQSSIKPMGRDGTCAMLAGVINIAVDGKTSRGAMAACITTVRSKVLSLYAYEPYIDATTIAKLVQEVRGIADALIAQNEARN